MLKLKVECQDPNMIRPEGIKQTDVRFYSPLDEPFSLYGLIYDDNRYLRMPKAIAETVSEGVRNQSQHTTGGRVCFKTNSPYVAITCKCYFYWDSSIMPLSGTHGFEVEIKDGDEHCFCGLIAAKYDTRSNFCGTVELPKDGKERNVILYFPTDTGVSELNIGLAEGASLSKWDGYTYETPVVFYGSSITHGACSSMPGNTYIGMLSRYFDTNYINLGMSGHCKAERNMIDYIASLPMSMFVYDYDHNAPTPEYLRETHFSGYLRFREKCPDTPVIMATRPNIDGGRMVPEVAERKEIVLSSYSQALALGDKNVSYVEAGDIYDRFCRSGFANDNVHPNDLGFYFMAKAFAPYIKKYLK